MWQTSLQSEGIRVYFTLVDSKGVKITGAASDVTVTVANPGDTASTSPTVSELTQITGEYTFLVPVSFLTTHGVGSYPVQIEINKTTSPKITDTKSLGVRVQERDADSVLDIVIDDSLTAETVLRYLLSMAVGEFTTTVVSPTIKDFVFEDHAGSTIYSLRIEENVGRTRLSG